MQVTFHDNTAQDGWSEDDNNASEGFLLENHKNRGAISVSPSAALEDDQMTENVVPPYNDYADVKESDVPTLVPAAHQSAYKALYGDVDTTSTSNISDSSAHTCNSDVLPVVKESRKPRSGNSEQFPMKLYRMLSVVEDLGLSHTVSWKPHGRAFRVNDTEEFVSSILSRFFRQSKITSFQRQLNLYGFRRFLHGADAGAYYHELFLRDKPFLCKAMFRTKVKGSNSRRKASKLVGTEPTFYNMRFMPVFEQSGRDERLRSFFGSEEEMRQFIQSVSSENEVRSDGKDDNRQAETKKRKRERENDQKALIDQDIELPSQHSPFESDANGSRDFSQQGSPAFRNEPPDHVLSNDNPVPPMPPLRINQLNFLQRNSAVTSQQNSHLLNMFPTRQQRAQDRLPLLSNHSNLSCFSNGNNYPSDQSLKNKVTIDQLTPTSINTMQQNSLSTSSSLSNPYSMILEDDDYMSFFRALLRSSE